MEYEIRQLREGELDPAFDLDKQSFNGDESFRPLWLRHMRPEWMHGAFQRDGLVALVATIPLGQWFGGRCVAMGGLSSVSVEPAHRGVGLAARVIDAALDAMRGRGQVISALYPATSTLYRSLGWELAGAYVVREIPTRALRALPRPTPGRVRRAAPDDVPAVQHCYESFAPQVGGFLARDASRWWRLSDRFDDHFVYVVPGVNGGLDGYAIYRHEAESGRYRWTIAVVEVIANTREALSALWWTIGSSATQVERVVYTSSPEDPLLLLVPEQDERVRSDLRWMLRLNDPAGAIAQRGYASSLDVEVELAVTAKPGALTPDDVAAADRYVLRVSKGEGRLEPGGRGAVALGPGAFASLYSGWATTSTLARTGLLIGGGAEDRERLDAVFAGPTPYLIEEF